MERDQIRELYLEHARALFGFLAYRTGDRAEAEDLLSETFARALRGRGRFDRRRASEKTWLYTIALNLVRDRARRGATEARTLERLRDGARADEAPTAIAIADERQALRAALATLSREEQEAVALRFGADLSNPEIAAALGERLTTVDGRVYRALRKLRAALDPDSA